MFSASGVVIAGVINRKKHRPPTMESTWVVHIANNNNNNNNDKNDKHREYHPTNQPINEPNKKSISKMHNNKFSEYWYLIHGRVWPLRHAHFSHSLRDPSNSKRKIVNIGNNCLENLIDLGLQHLNSLLDNSESKFSK
jgi:hypothetical protein